VSRSEDVEIREFMLAVGAVPRVHVQRMHVLKARLASGVYLMSAPPGTPDVYCCAGGHHVWLEFKRPGGGRAEESQKVWHNALRAAGGEVWVVRDGKKAAADILKLLERDDG
jgi:hypothetical protein